MTSRLLTGRTGNQELMMVLKILIAIIFVRIWRIFICHKSLDAEAKPVLNTEGTKPEDRVFGG